jgi:hypothetical protein
MWSLVGLGIKSQLGSFVGLLIDSSNQIKWFTWTWFPATKLRLANAFTGLAKRKSANSTKNFEIAGTAFYPLLFIAAQIIFKTQADLLV